MIISTSGYLVGKFFKNRLVIAVLAFVAGAVAARSIVVVAEGAQAVADALAWLGDFLMVGG